MVTFSIDGIQVTACEGTMILKAAEQVSIYIPHLCFHPVLPPSKGLKPAKSVFQGAKRIDNQYANEEYEGCQLCVVKVGGEENFYQACSTPVTQGMVVSTNTPELQEFRRDKLMLLLAKHPRVCLTCAQKEGCAREPCSMNIPVNERCCPLFGHCEFQRIAEYVGIKPETQRYAFESLPIVKDEPLFERNYNLCIGCTRCIRVCRDVLGVGAVDFVFDKEGRVTVGSLKLTFWESGCRFCTACVEVCPTGALSDKETFEEAPCKVTCPAKIDVPRYIHLIGEGKFSEAAAVIRESIPFPAILGYICTRDCEVKCRRGEINEPISIRNLKRFVAEREDKQWKKIKIAAPTGKKVGVIGAGPAGLTAAYHLRKLGHLVTIFESRAKAGGIMRTGIPRFLLPEETLDREINEILSLGIELKLNSQVQNVAELLSAGFDSVLIAVGLQVGQKLPIPGSDASRVLVGLDFLEAASKGEKIDFGNNVLVLGGGGVACDVARTARRLGASQVSMACLESEETMPARAWDIKETREEGVSLFPSRSFKKIIDKDGEVCGVECVKVKTMRFDEEGKLHLETFPDSEHTIEADTVVFSTGQGLDRTLVEKSGIGITRRGTVKVSNDTLETNLKGVFACGDAVTGPASVIEAIAAGRKAANSIDKYLGGGGIIEESLVEKEKISLYLGKDEAFYQKNRIDVHLLPGDERVKSFEQVSLSLNNDEAVTEAKRCLRCNLRLQIPKVTLPPKEKLWLDFTSERVGTVPGAEGVYQLLDDQEKVIYIKGTMNLHRELEEQLSANQKACYFMYEKHSMYSKRESELLQQFIAEHGEMPEGNRELEDLF